MIPLLTYQNLISHVDGSSIAPAATLTSNEKQLKIQHIQPGLLLIIVLLLLLTLPYPKKR